jgi:hypothetical protein
VAIHRIKMPKRDDGRQIPNPYRYACDYGHFHPSRKHAVECHRRVAAEGQRRIDAHSAHSVSHDS